MCTTGKNGAEELKTYLERYGQLEGMTIIPLAIVDRDRLREELVRIMNTSVIQCLVGTFDPKLFALPFVSVSEVFGTPKEKLPLLLRQVREGKLNIDYTEVFSYLNEQLEHTDVGKLKKLLPDFIHEVNDKICELSPDSEVGLFIHVACCIARIRSKEPTPKNVRREIIKRLTA